MDSIQTWLMEVGVKKLLPAFIKGGVAWLIVYMGAHQGLLNSLGITWDASGHTIDIDLDTLSAWTLTVGSGGLMALFAAIQHHATAAVTGKPQDGDHQRATDPPKTA